MFSITPLTEEELSKFNLIEEGIYDFQVVKSTSKISKSGNPMAELCLNVWSKEGKQYLVYDYLVFSSVALNIKKIKHFCDSVGLQEEYKKGSIPEDLQNLSGKVSIGIKEPQPNPNGGFYPEKNIVIDYYGRKTCRKPEENNDFIDDKDLPF